MIARTLLAPGSGSAAPGSPWPVSALGRVALAAAGGALFALVGPPANLRPAPWLGMTLLALALGVPGESPASGWPRVSRVLEGAGRGLAFGIGANLVLLRFVPAVLLRFAELPSAVGAAMLFLLAALQGAGWALAGLVHGRLARAGVPSWLSFAVGVYAGAFVPAMLPWTPAGFVSTLPQMVQLADLVGERGVAWLMAATAALLAEGVRRARGASAGRRRAMLLVAAAAALPVLTYVHGALRIARVEQARDAAPKVTLGLVDPSIGALARWEPGRGPNLLAGLTALTLSAERQGAELTVWTEGAYPYSVGHDHPTGPSGARAVVGEGVRGPILAGFVSVDPKRDQYNSAAVFTADGAASPSYDKMRLLAFGERIPLVGGIPWVKKTFVRAYGLVAGRRNVVQTAGPLRASVLICVEDILPEAGRDAMADHPNLLVNLTNDAWFEGSREGEMHLTLSALRAVESRRDLVRAVNFGPTSWIDAAGVVRSRYDGPAPGVLMVTPSLLESPLTFYARFGDAPLALLLLVGSCLFVARARRGR